MYPTQMESILSKIYNRVCCISNLTGEPQPITFAPSTSQDSFGRLRVSEPFTLFDSSHRYDDNVEFKEAVST